MAAAFGVVYLAAGLWAAQRAAGSGQGGLGRATAAIRFYKFSGFAGYGWLALVAVAVLVAAIAGFGKLTAKLDRAGSACCWPC